MAQRFNPTRVSLVGSASPVAEKVGGDVLWTAFSASENGTPIDGANHPHADGIVESEGASEREYDLSLSWTLRSGPRFVIRDEQSLLNSGRGVVVNEVGLVVGDTFALVQTILVVRLLIRFGREFGFDLVGAANAVIATDTVNQVNAAGRPTETRDRSQSAWWCVEWRVRMNHTSQKWPEFGGFPNCVHR
jgi:hypothetical protein